MFTTVNTLISTFLGSIIAAISNASLLYTGHLVARRFFKDEPAAVRWVAFGLVSAWLVIVLSVTLIFTHVFTIPGVTISSIGIAGLAWFFWRRHSSLRQELTEAHAFILPYIRGRSAMLFLAAFFAVLFQITRAIMMPPVSWDSLTYHMTLAGLWVQNGGYARLLIPDALDGYSHFPNNGEVFFSWLMVPFQSDLLVNLGNFPFLVLGAFAVYGLARELGVDREGSLLASAWVSFSPPLVAYAGNPYVDVQGFAEGLSGVFFLVKYVRSGQPRDVIMAFAALGMAAGTKVLFLQLLLICFVITFCILLWKRISSRSLLIMTIGIILLAGTAGVPWYVRNWIETGSPLYPFRLSIGGMEILPGSQYLYAVISSLEMKLKNETHGLLSYWVKVFDIAGRFPASFGPKFVPVVIGGIVGLILGLRSRNWAQWLIIGIICCSEFAQFMSKGMRTLRWKWPDISPKFLMLYFALVTISGIFILTKTRRWKQPAVIILACFVMLNFLTNNFNSFVYLHGEYYLLTAAVFLTFAFLYFIYRGKMLKLKIFFTVIIILIIFLPLMQLYRDRTRHLRFMDAIDFRIPKDAVPVWKLVDNPSMPITIAVTAGWEEVGHNWRLYPLMGRRLQNRLTYISPAQPGELVSYVPGLDSFKRVDASSWIGRMREAGVDRVFVIMPAPPELAWIEDNPNFFKLLQATQDYRIYEFEQHEEWQ